MPPMEVTVGSLMLPLKNKLPKDKKGFDYKVGEEVLEEGVMT